MDDEGLEVAELQLLADSLSCPLCKEVLEGPVVSTVCGHIYCSKCIRRFVDHKVKSNEKPYCPFCRAPCTDADLRRVDSLRQAVGALGAAQVAVAALLTRVQAAEDRAVAAEQQLATAKAAFAATTALRAAAARAGSGSGQVSEAGAGTGGPGGAAAGELEDVGQGPGGSAGVRGPRGGRQPAMVIDDDEDVVEEVDGEGEEGDAVVDGGSDEDYAPSPDGDRHGGRGKRRRSEAAGQADAKRAKRGPGRPPGRGSKASRAAPEVVEEGDEEDEVVEAGGGGAGAGPTGGAAGRGGMEACPVCNMPCPLERLEGHVLTCLERSSGRTARAATPPVPAAGRGGAHATARGGGGAAGAAAAGRGRAGTGDAGGARPGAGQGAAAQPTEVQVPNKVVFNLLKDKVLKKMLKDLKLQAVTNRKENEDLYTRYRIFLKTKQDEATTRTMEQLHAEFLRDENDRLNNHRLSAAVPQELRAQATASWDQLIATTRARQGQGRPRSTWRDPEDDTVDAQGQQQQMGEQQQGQEQEQQQQGMEPGAAAAGGLGLQGPGGRQEAGTPLAQPPGGLGHVSGEEAARGNGAGAYGGAEATLPPAPAARPPDGAPQGAPAGQGWQQPPLGVATSAPSAAGRESPDTVISISDTEEGDDGEAGQEAAAVTTATTMAAEPGPVAPAHQGTPYHTPQPQPLAVTAGQRQQEEHGQQRQQQGAGDGAAAELFGFVVPMGAGPGNGQADTDTPHDGGRVGWLAGAVDPASHTQCHNQQQQQQQQEPLQRQGSASVGVSREGGLPQQGPAATPPQQSLWGMHAAGEQQQQQQQEAPRSRWTGMLSFGGGARPSLGMGAGVSPAASAVAGAMGTSGAAHGPGGGTSGPSPAPMADISNGTGMKAAARGVWVPGPAAGGGAALGQGLAFPGFAAELTPGVKGMMGAALSPLPLGAKEEQYGSPAV